MVSNVVAFLLGCVLVVASIMHVNQVAAVVINPPAILLVFGGTIVVACMTYPFRDLVKIGRITRDIFKNKTDDLPSLAKEISTLARETRGDVLELQSASESVKSPLLKEGVMLLVERVAPERIEVILRDRMKSNWELNGHAVQMLGNLSKYPPSFGIIGTVLGLIGLLLELGVEGGSEKLGYAMAVGLVATFYGLLLTNFVLAPLSENISYRASVEYRKRQMVMVGVLLLAANESPSVVQESVNAMLAPDERVDVLGIAASEEQPSDVRIAA